MVHIGTLKSVSFRVLAPYPRGHATVNLVVFRTRTSLLLGRTIMNTLSVITILWGIFFTAFIALMVYRGHLTQHETDQLFLSENAPPSVREENEEIIRRVNFIQPICTGVGGVAALFTVLVFGVWLVQTVAKSHS
jgi:predicted membrane protein